MFPPDEKSTERMLASVPVLNGVNVLAVRIAQRALGK